LKIRRRYVVSGSVQGVGFRYRAYYVARDMGLTGYVRNMFNGDVEVEVQGDEDSVMAFLMKVEEGHFIHIDNVRTTKLEVDEFERDFSVRDSY